MHKKRYLIFEKLSTVICQKRYAGKQKQISEHSEVNILKNVNTWAKTQAIQEK